MHNRRTSRGAMPPPGPTYMSQERMGEYLNDLRSNRIQRPTGARPCPSHITKHSLRGRVEPDRPDSGHSSSSSESRDRVQHSQTSSAQSTRPSTAQPLRTSISLDRKTSLEDPDRRHTKKTEARLIRLALEDIDNNDEETLIANARTEADELIRKHERPDAPYLATTPPTHTDVVQEAPVRSEEINTQHFSGTTEPVLSVKKRTSIAKMASACANVMPTHRRRSSAQKRSASGKYAGVFANPEDKIYEDPVESEPTPQKAPLPEPVKRAERPVENLPDSGTVPSYIRKNPFARAQAARQSRSDIPYRLAARPSFNHSDERPRDHVLPAAVDSMEVEQLNQPNDLDEAPRFKNGVEVRNDDLRAATSFSLRNRSPRLPSPTAVSDNSSRPIVSFKPDWRPPETEQAEKSPPRSSPQRPSPVPRRLRGGSDDDPLKSVSAPAVPTLKRLGGQDLQYNNGRLVDETPAQEPPYGSSRHAQQPLPAPSIQVSAAPSISVDDRTPQVPTINISDEPPTPDPKPIPTINLPPEPTNTHSTPTANPPHPRTRPLPIHASTASSVPRATYSPFPPAPRPPPAAQCAQCGLPISGKIVTAAGVRFHPSCFTCHTCTTQLECVAFYPEPDNKREERLERIERRARGDVVDGEEDGDDGLRFYCHLDFHELFSPRCKSCKTPIEGEVVVACGAEWHQGHFFCAECGDPFNATTPFVEKDGYAWCIRCHTNRFSTKCRKCRRPVTEMVVRALDAEWHAECFTCVVCEGGFEDGRYFVGMGGGPVCWGCEERRVKG